MNIEQYALRRDQAYKEWKNYINAVKANPKDRFLQDMKAVYNQLKSGRKLIDIYKIFEIAGCKIKNGINTYEPQLAISPAHLIQIVCAYRKSGRLYFKDLDSWRGKIFVDIKFPPIPDGILGKWDHEKVLRTIVPKIPATLRPKGNLKKYYVLWEVEKWEAIPKDPYLLKRVTKNIFVILAGWDLTELERSVIAGRAW